jgi:hypothetical protein
MRTCIIFAVVLACSVARGEYLGSRKIDDTLTFVVTTHNPATGAEVDADSLPTYRVYEDETTTPIITGTMAKLDDSNTVGFYSEQITLSAANGLEKGKSYNIKINGVVSSAPANTAKTFQIEAEVDANIVSDKTGYSLTVTPPTANEVRDAVLGAVRASFDAAGSVGEFFNDVYAALPDGGDQIAGEDAIPTAASNADAVWDELLAGHVTADTFGQTMNWLKAAFESSGVYSEAALANAPEGGGTILTDVDQEPVPASRVFDLIPTEDQGLIAEKPKSIVIGADPNTYAVDFKVDMPTNGRIATVSAPTIASGTSGGITFANLGRDKSQAKFRPTAVTAGEYEVRIEVEYTSGASAVGTVLLTVVE